MSFAQRIKNEVLKQELNEVQASAFIGGIISTAGTRDGSKIIVKLNNNEMSETIRDLLNQMEIEHTTTKENKN